LHTSCRVVRAAVANAQTQSANRSQLAILNTAGPNDYVFRSDLTDPDRVTLLALSKAVWVTRNNLRDLPPASRDPHKAAQQIAALLLSYLKKATKSKTKRVRTKEKREFMSLLSSLPKDALRAFTDGSSYLGDDARAGAGYVITNPTLGPIYHFSFFMGKATNNAAELKALTLATRHLTRITRRSSVRPRRHVHLFLDNLYAKNIGDGNWIAKSNLGLVGELLDALRSLRALTQVTLFWVPGHAGIFENDLSDFLAKRGAEGVTGPAPPSEADLTKIRCECAVSQPTNSPSRKRQKHN
jgi:ribonuclease HI